MRRINLIQARGFFFRKEDGCNATQIGTGDTPNIKKTQMNYLELMERYGKDKEDGPFKGPNIRLPSKSLKVTPRLQVDAPLTGRCSHPCGS